MRNRAKRFGIIAAIAIIGFSMTGCATAAAVDPFPSRFPAISDYSFIPSKDFVVVGAVVVRNTSHQNLAADIMDAVIAVGGHDFINLRIDWRSVPGAIGVPAGAPQINNATAVAIRFTDETIIVGPESHYFPGYGNRGGGADVGNIVVDDAGAGGGGERGFFGRGR